MTGRPADWDERMNDKPRAASISDLMDLDEAGLVGDGASGIERRFANLKRAAQQVVEGTGGSSFPSVAPPFSSGRRR